MKNTTLSERRKAVFEALTGAEADQRDSQVVDETGPENGGEIAEKNTDEAGADLGKSAPEELMPVEPTPGEPTPKELTPGDPKPGEPTAKVVKTKSSTSNRRLLIEMTCILGFCNAAATTYYFSLSFLADKFTLSRVDRRREDFNLVDHNWRLVNFLLLALLEFPGILLFAVMAKKMPRRRFGSLIFFLSSLPMLTLVCCRLALGAALPDGAVLGISLVGKIFITPATMCFINLIPTEIFPTKYRATATTIVVGIGRCFQIPSMYSPDLYQKNPMVVESIFGVWTAVSALLVLRLPETKDHALPQDTNDLRILHDATPKFWKSSCCRVKT